MRKLLALAVLCIVAAVVARLLQAGPATMFVFLVYGVVLAGFCALMLPRADATRRDRRGGGGVPPGRD